MRCCTSIVLSAIAWVLVAGLVGCASNERVRGWIPAIEPGQLSADFDYVDSTGKSKSFAKLLGDYTVLAFRKCEASTDDSTTTVGLAAQMVAENRRAFQVRVTGVDIHWSAKGCGQHKCCHMVKEGAGIASLCDGAGVVRKLYGAGAEDAVYIIGPDHRVVAAAPASMAERLRAQLKTAVDTLADERYERANPQVSDN